MLAAAVVVLATGLVASPGPASASGPQCTEHTVSVSLTDGGAVDQTIVGDLCLPATGTPETVQLLVHGGTYGRAYWDFPYQPYLYSYRQYANTAGYATFNVDLPGVGESSHPNSSLVDVFSSATALHQVITKLRAGTIGPVAFDKVVYVGHSLGVATGWAVASTYGGIDGFIATGAARALSTTGSAPLIADVIPAAQDPKFAPLNLDSGYLALPPATRAQAFYHPTTSDPQVVAVDNNTREPMTANTQISGIGVFLQPVQTAVTLDITVPVLSVFGGRDALFCAADAYDCTNYTAIKQAEAPYYANAASFDLVIVPETGHDLNTHYTAPYTFLTMLAWAATHVAP
ncbi:alpha/beta hydrolase [Micromonospora echinofusca]|uniref:Alpha/beta fold hydrolase n=1 Tax=Micromonospora echinofusca TaxID=47858 RepID=A0ABS3VPV4_MICEH|nr:alpha/beta hydrolase [Micromonospora echinofusca]MBO4206574.1 alpha/beta fold hydrolase [Micromonospora echinofusca]